MRKAVRFSIATKLIAAVIFLIGIYTVIVNADTITIPITNPGFEEDTEGYYENLTFMDSMPYAEQYYNIPGWSMYKEFAYSKGASELYVGDKTFDGMANPTEGVKCLNLIDETTGVVNIWSDKIDITEGLEYTLTHDLYSEAGLVYTGVLYFNSQGMLLKVDANGVVTANPDTPANRTTSYFAKWVITSSTSGANANKWVTVSGKLKPPAGASSLRIAFSRVANYTVSSSVDNVRLTYEGQAKGISVPDFGGHSGRFVPDENVNLSITVSNLYKEHMPVMFIAGVYDNSGRMYSVNAASNLADTTVAGKMNLSVKMPSDVSDKHIRVMVLNISEGRIKSYYEPVRFPASAQ